MVTIGETEILDALREYGYKCSYTNTKDFKKNGFLKKTGDSYKSFYDDASEVFAGLALIKGRGKKRLYEYSSMIPKEKVVRRVDGRGGNREPYDEEMAEMLFYRLKQILFNEKYSYNEASLGSWAWTLNFPMALERTRRIGFHRMLSLFLHDKEVEYCINMLESNLRCRSTDRVSALFNIMKNKSWITLEESHRVYDPEGEVTYPSLPMILKAKEIRKGLVESSGLGWLAFRNPHKPIDKETGDSIRRIIHNQTGCYDVVNTIVVSLTDVGEEVVGEYDSRKFFELYDKNFARLDNIRSEDYDKQIINGDIKYDTYRMLYKHLSPMYYHLVQNKTRVDQDYFKEKFQHNLEAIQHYGANRNIDPNIGFGENKKFKELQPSLVKGIEETLDIFFSRAV